MKLYFLAFCLVLLSVTFFGCKKNNDGIGGGISCDLPSTPVPEELVGNWAAGYNSSTQIVDAYNGRYLGNAFQSGKYFRFTSDGKNAEVYHMANAGLGLSSATRVIGTVEFLDDDSFIFHACKARYRGWRNGRLTIDRDATASEVTGEDLTRRYYYSFVESGDVLYMQIRFDPDSPSATSFRMVP